MPNYNKGPFIEEAIRSVMDQTYLDWELIVVDDCSMDQSRAVLDLLASEDVRVKVILNETNMGGNASRNRALDAATGDFVIFFDSDDWMAPFCIEQRVAAASGCPSADMMVYPMGVFREKVGDMSQAHYWQVPKEGFIQRFLSHRLPWAICQVMWANASLKKLNGFDLSFVRLQDVELHTRALLGGAQVRVFPAAPIDTFYRTDDGRFSSDVGGYMFRFSQGVMQYYQKFFPMLSAYQQRLLSGTLLEVLSQLCSRRRQGTIDKQMFHQLTAELTGACAMASHRFWLRTYVGIDRLFPFHPKGLKKITALLLRFF